MSLIKIDYPNGGGFEVEADTRAEAVSLAYFAIATLWGRKTLDTNYGADPISLDDMDAWLGRSMKQGN